MVAVAPAHAGILTFDFSYSGVGVTASGVITASSTPDGSGFDILSVTGTRNGVAIDGLLGGDPGIGDNLSPSAYFYFDNVLFPDADPVVDHAGLLFDIGGVEFNVYSNGPDEYIEYQNTGANVAVAFDPSLVPEPAAIVLFGTALAGFVFLRRRSARAVKPADARRHRVV
jgi:hypothetical protein